MADQPATSTWAPSVQPVGPGPRPRPQSQLFESGAPFTQTSLAHNQPQAAPAGTAYNSSPKPFATFGTQTIPAIVNKQFNSPVNLYSMSNIAKALEAHTEILAPGVKGINFMKPEVPVNTNSAVLQAILEDEARGRGQQGDVHVQAPNSAHATQPAHSGHPGYSGHATLAVAAGGELRDTASSPTIQSHAFKRLQAQLDGHVPNGSPQPPPCSSSPISPPMRQGFPQHINRPAPSAAPPVIRHVDVPTPGPPPPAGPAPGQNICADCGRLIVGVFCRINERALHAECFKCSTCGTSLKNVGYFNINDKLYCDVHAQQAAQMISPRADVPGPNLIQQAPAPAPAPQPQAQAPAGFPKQPQAPFTAPKIAIPLPTGIPQSSGRASPLVTATAAMPWHAQQQYHHVDAPASPLPGGGPGHSLLQTAPQLPFAAPTQFQSGGGRPASLYAAAAPVPWQAGANIPPAQPAQSAPTFAPAQQNQSAVNQQVIPVYATPPPRPKRPGVGSKFSWPPKSGPGVSEAPAAPASVPQGATTYRSQPSSGPGLPQQQQQQQPSQQQQQQLQQQQSQQLQSYDQQSSVSAITEQRTSSSSMSSTQQVTKESIEGEALVVAQHVIAQQQQINAQTYSQQQSQSAQGQSLVESQSLPSVVHSVAQLEQQVAAQQLQLQQQQQQLQQQSQPNPQQLHTFTSQTSSVEKSSSQQSSSTCIQSQHFPGGAPAPSPIVQTPGPTPDLSQGTPAPVQNATPQPFQPQPSNLSQVPSSPAGLVTSAAPGPPAPAPSAQKVPPPTLPKPAAGPQQAQPPSSNSTAAPWAAQPSGQQSTPAAPSSVPGPGQSTVAGSQAPRRGRGQLKPGAAPSTRIPICVTCQTAVRGPFIVALGKSWCPDHFLCANNQCKKSLQEVGFVEEQGQLYCESCFEAYLAPICAKCNTRIKGDCLVALDKQWHPTCFACSYCSKAFGNASFYLEDGQPYCEKDWNELFTTKCVGCGFPIEAGDRWVEALSNNYHSQCFKCTVCAKNLEGQSFYAKGGRPFCKSHAR